MGLPAEFLIEALISPVLLWLTDLNVQILDTVLPSGLSLATSTYRSEYAENGAILSVTGGAKANFRVSRVS